MHVSESAAVILDVLEDVAADDRVDAEAPHLLPAGGVERKTIGGNFHHRVFPEGASKVFESHGIEIGGDDELSRDRHSPGLSQMLRDVAETGANLEHALSELRAKQIDEPPVVGFELGQPGKSDVADVARI